MSDIPINEDSIATSARLSNSPNYLANFDSTIPTSVPFQTSSLSASSSHSLSYDAPLHEVNTIHFDPKASPSSDDEEPDIEIEENHSGGGGDHSETGGGPRLKKRKSTMNLRNVDRPPPSSMRSATNMDAFNAGFATLTGGTHLATEADYNFGMGNGLDDDDKDKGRRKIQIEYIEEKSKRHITFSKRKAGIMKKAYELSTLTGTQVLLLVVSESGWVYTFTTDKFKPLVKEDEFGNLSQGQKLIAACLETPEKLTNSGQSSNRSSGSGPSHPANSTTMPNLVPQPRDFETNSQNLPLGNTIRAGRPTATNRRVSGSKGRPPPIRTDMIPPVPSLPSPMSGNLVGLQPGTPLYQLDSTRPRSMSMHPASPMGLNPGLLQQQQQQAEMENSLGGLHSPLTAGGQEYLKMLQRAQYGQQPQYLAQPQPVYTTNILHHHTALQNLSGSNQPQLRQESSDPNLNSAHIVSRDYQLHQQQQLQQHQLLHGGLDSSSIFSNELEIPRSLMVDLSGVGMNSGNDFSTSGIGNYQTYTF